MYEIEDFCLEVGAARSGTNFLGLVLSEHPRLVYWRRPKYIWRHGNAWKKDDCLRPEDATPRVQRYIRRRFWEYMKKHGKDRLLVCTQANVVALEFANAVYPDGKVIHIIRDGREVAASQKREWEIHVNPEKRSVLIDRLPEVPITDWPAYAGEYFGNAWRRFLGAKHRFSMGPKIKNWRHLSQTMDKLEFSALNWVECVRAARAVGRNLLGDRYYEVRFEHLMNQPHETINGVLEFMRLPPSKEIDQYIDENVRPETSGKWLKRLTQDEIDRILPYMQELLEELGYDTSATKSEAETAR